MTDKYDNFADLAGANVQGVDYDIRHSKRGSSIVILAPHGGHIEPETSSIAEEIAGEDFSFYAFESLKPGPHGAFHITSNRFDEPTARKIVGDSSIAVAIHGRRDDGTEAVWLGGLDIKLRDRIGTFLNSAGFDAEPNKKLPGRDPKNICNCTRSGKGVQLELPRSLRARLKSDTNARGNFCRAIRRAINSAPIA